MKCESFQENKIFISYHKEKDKTLGEILLEILENFGLLWDNCGQDNWLHRQYFYHKDGYVEWKITENKSEQKDETHVYLSSYWKEWKKMIQNREEVNAGMLEYSFGLFLKQYFYNRKLANIPKFGSHCNHLNFNCFQRMFEFGSISISFEYKPVEKYTIDLYDLRQVNTRSDSLFRDMLIEKLITNFVEVYRGLEAMIAVIDISETVESKSFLVKAKNLIKKFLKNFKLSIFETLKDGKIKEYLYVQYIFRYAFLNTLSMAYLINELYNVNLLNSEKDLKEGLDRNIKKFKSSRRISVLSFNSDKISKFNKAMIMHTLTHNKQSNIENKEIKEEK